MDMNELIILSTGKVGERYEYTPKYSRHTRIYTITEGGFDIAYYDRKEYKEGIIYADRGEKK
jgi:hypothetical protein